VCACVCVCVCVCVGVCVCLSKSFLWSNKINISTHFEWELTVEFLAQWHSCSEFGVKREHKKTLQHNTHGIVQIIHLIYLSYLLIDYIYIHTYIHIYTHIFSKCNVLICVAVFWSDI